MTHQSFRELPALAFARKVKTILTNLNEAMDKALYLPEPYDDARPYMLYAEREKAQALVVMSNSFEGKDPFITVTVEDMMAILRLEALTAKLEEYVKDNTA